MRALELLREASRDVVWRSLLVMAAAALLVMVAYASGLPERAAASARHADSAHSTSAASEASFLSRLIAHRQEALERAQEILHLTEREEVRDLAAMVLRDHGPEIGLLEAWLSEVQGEPTATESHEPVMRRFVGLRAHEADQVFVADMIHHHETVAALAESYLALRRPKRPEVVAHAEGSMHAQLAETPVLRLMLQMWGVAPVDHESH